METWLLLRAYRKSPAPYPMVPSLTLYDLRFSHNTSVTYGWRTTDDNHANSSTVAQVRSAKNAHYHASRITDPTPITLSVKFGVSLFKTVVAKTARLPNLLPSTEVSALIRCFSIGASCMSCSDDAAGVECSVSVIIRLSYTVAEGATVCTNCHSDEQARREVYDQYWASQDCSVCCDCYILHSCLVLVADYDLITAASQPRPTTNSR